METKQRQEDVELKSTRDELEEDENLKNVRWLSHPFARKLLTWGVESRGVHPVPEHLRTDTQYHKIFFIWFTSNFNILSFSAGSLGPLVFGLPLTPACLVITFFTILCSIPPAYLATWGPKTGMRQMVLGRYAFGFWGVILVCVLNVVNMVGFCILNCILGGQTLASVNTSMSWTVGIVIIGVLSIVLSFFGYSVLNWYERVAWFPVLIVYLVAIGISGKHFVSSPPAGSNVAEEPVTASQVLSYASTVAGYTITYSSLASDFTSYYRPDAPSWKMFSYTVAGLSIPTVLVQSLGATAAYTATFIPSWNAVSETSGGLILAILSPSATPSTFAKFLTVLLALSATANISMTFYSISLNVQLFIPGMVKIPRYIGSLVAGAIVIPIAITGAHRFYDTLVNFLGLIGYWASAYIAITVSEHIVFRRPAALPVHVGSRFESYNPAHWASPSLLPSGIPAVLALVLCFGVVVPFMDQVWYQGPIAKLGAGDIGFEVAFVVAGLMYLLFRGVEVRWFNGRR